MAGLVPAIHVSQRSNEEDVDARHKAGHDRVNDRPSPAVITGLVAGIHLFAARQRRKTWMAGTSPAMTE